MTLAIQVTPVPLRDDADGTVRIGGTRVLLDTVISSFRSGASAEQIAEQYPDLELADVYAVIGYYLRNTVAVDAYLSRRRQESERLRAEIEAKFDPQRVRDRLLARRAQRG
jgi:uncharacterized protein (DUF433 family)